MKKNIFTLIALVFATGYLYAQPTWSGSVAKILYENCTGCHHSGGIGPFSLMTYQDAYNYRFSLNYSVGVGNMPPWTPDPAYKNFAHERVLSQAQITEIQNWVSNGAPSGDLRFAPAAPVYNNTSQLGTPDLSLRIPTYTVASNNDDYHNFVIPSGLSSSSFATAIEVIPGNNAIVHHVLVFHDSTANPISPSSAGGTGSTSSKLLYGYTPGTQPYYTPVGAGIRLPANTRIVVQVHYAPGSMGMSDSTRINFKLASGPMRSISVDPILNHFTSLQNGPLSIPANTTRTFNEQALIPTNLTFLYAFPHMHLIGRSIKSYATTTIPNDTIRFVNIPEWDFNWQDNFVFPNTIKVPTGSTLKAVASYDNTSNNIFNPNNPPQNVVAGEGTGDEMMMVFFAYMPYLAGDENIIVDKRILVRGNPTFCQGQSVLLKTIAGTGYTYQWKLNGTNINGATSPTYYATQSGSYTVQINLGPNTATSDPVVVTVNPVPIATISPSGTTSIPTNGSLTLTASTGSGYSYNWYRNDTLITGANASTYNATQAGSYYVEVFNGCYAISNPTVLTTTSCAISLNGSSTDAVCTSSNGSATVSVSGGTAPFSYTWNNGANAASNNNLSAGVYTVTVTDVNNCQSVGSVTVSTSNPVITINATQTNSTCSAADGSISVNVGGGTAPLVYNWSNGGNSATLNNLSSGTYNLTLSDANGCVQNAAVIVGSNNTAIAANQSFTNASCGLSDGSATVVPTNGTSPYSYIWNTGVASGSLTNVPAGNYTVTVTDANGCQGVFAQIVSNPNAPAVTLNNQNDVACAGYSTGLISVSANSGTAPYSYIWSNGEQSETISNLIAGVYTVTITDAASCSGIGSYVVSEPTVISTGATGNNISCNGFADGSIQTSTSGGVQPYNYSWSNGETNSSLNSLSAGSYTYTITDGNGCLMDLNVPVFITEPSAISVSTQTNAASMIGAADGSAMATISGGTAPYLVNWSNGQSGENLTGVIAGNYQYTVTDANGCLSTGSVTVADGPTSVGNISMNNFSLYPNPNNGQAVLSVELSETNSLSFEIYNAIGQIVYSKSDNNVSKALYPIITVDWSAGVYFINVKTEREQKLLKMIVE